MLKDEKDKKSFGNVFGIADDAESGLLRTKRGADACGHDPGRDGAAAPAQWTPSGSVDFVCPYGAGGGSDVCARTIASVMTDGGYCDASVVVQNLSGGGGLVGTTYVYGKKGDDMTLCTYAPGQLASAIANNSECQWDSITQIALLAFEEQTICTAAGKFESLDALISYSKEHPGEVTIGGCGIGNEDNVCAALLNSVAGADVTYVLYDSAGDMMTAILGGHLTGGIFNPSECTAQVQSAMWTAWLPSVPTAFPISWALKRSPPARAWDMISTSGCSAAWPAHPT